MSRFGGRPQDIVVDPSDRGPVQGAHIYIYPQDPAEGASDAISDLTDYDGNPLPGYVPTDVAGRVRFDTITPYLVVWGVDPIGRIYRYDSAESNELSGDIIELFPSLQATVAQSQAAAVAAQEAAEAAQEAAENASTSALKPFYDMPHPHPYVSFHRGGAYIHPEGTRVGRINAVGLGAQVIDGGDVHATMDGVLYDMHDITVDRTTNLTGRIDELSSMRIMQGKIDASVWFGGGWADQPITSIVDTLDDLGGKVHVTFEIKSEPGDLENCQKLVDLIVQRKLDKTILIASFEEALLAPAIAADMEVMLLGTSMTTIADRNDLLSLGIRYVGGSQSMTPETAALLMDKGLRVCAYGTQQHRDTNRYRDGLSGHLWGYMSDDPFYLKGHIVGDYAYRRTVDPFDSMTFYHGHQPDNMNMHPDYRGSFASGGWFCAPTQTTARRAWLQGWASPLVSPGNFTIQYEQDWTSDLTSDGGALVFGCPDDTEFEGDDSAGGGIGDEPGYMAWFFTSGLMRIYRRDPGLAPVLIAENDLSGAHAPGRVTTLTVDITGSTITFTNVTDGQSCVANDSTYRGAYVHLMCQPNGAAGGVRWRNFSIS